MLKFLITDQNFNEIKSRCEITRAGIVTKLHKTRNKITIKANSLAPFAIYKWEQDGHFAISNKLDYIEEYIKQFGCELTYTPTKSKYLYKDYVNRTRDCDVQKITKWGKVAINCQGVLQVTPPRKQLFSIELTSKRGVKYLLKWLKKYLIIAKQEINKNNFVPTLTAGMNTRAFTWFWRDLYQGNDYYLKTIKPNGKNNIIRGQEEVAVSLQVVSRLKKHLKQVESFGEKVTFSGMFCEINWTPEAFNDPNLIYDYISFHMNKTKYYFSQNYICLFVDNLFLQLRHPKTHYELPLLASLLCPDLLDDIPFYTYSFKPAYYYNEEFAYLIPEVEDFIQKYKLRKRVNRIKAKVLKFPCFFANIFYTIRKTWYFLRYGHNRKQKILNFLKFRRDR